jgi:hypothetical protein
MQSQALYDAWKGWRSFNLRDLRPDPVDATYLEHMLEMVTARLRPRFTPLRQSMINV